MEICIGGHCSPTCYEALSSRPKGLDAIIITDPHWPVPPYVPDLANDYLHMRFVDTPDPANPQCPTVEHVREMLEWAAGRNNLLICCHAGVSRSSATALLIASREVGMEEGFGVLVPGLHHPNRLILKHGSALLGLPVYETYKEWRKKHHYD